MPRRIAALWPWACAALSGALLVLSFAPFDQAWLAWIALGPLFAAIWFGPVPERHAILRKAELGYLTGLIYFLGSLCWLIHVTAPGWFILCLYLALYPAVWAAIVFIAATPRDLPGGNRTVWLSSWRNLLAGAVAAAAWVGLELLRGEVFTGFGWNSLGIAFHANAPLIQITAFTGVGGLSFLAVLSSAIAVATVRRLLAEARNGRVKAHFDFTITLGLIVAAFAYGLRALGRERGQTLPVRIAAVQPSIPQAQKWNRAYEDSIYETLERQTGVAAALKPDLILWPEAATPRGFLEDRTANTFAKSQFQKGDFSLLFGSLILGPQADYNAAIMLGDADAEPQIYPKTHLVMFGEYIPLRYSFPLFAIMVGDVVPSDFDAGDGPKIFRLPHPRIALAPLICFEDTVGDLARRAANDGAQLFVNLTNDSWFQRSAASRQHAAHAVFRCVENARPMVRCANTGLTCVIDASGRLRQTLASPEGDTFAAGVLAAEIPVPAAPGTTPYMRFGELFSALCLVASATALGTVIILRRSPLSARLQS